MDPISATNAVSNAISNDTNALIGDISGSNSFASVFSQALNQAKTPGQKAKLEFEQTQFSDLNTLYSMGSGDSSSPSSIAGLASILGSNDPFAAPPAWETQLASLLGPNSTAAQALSLDQQAALASQSLMNGDLNSLGSSVNSLF